MNFERRPVSAGLYLVSTPIGSARDITLRALDLLASCDMIAAEDTRTARKLMEIHGVALEGRRVVAYHDHSSEADRSRIVERIAGGASVAYVSEAGTPLVADPGFALARAVRARGLNVTAAPGASAVLAALTVAGLASDRFMFVGFLPTSTAARKTALAELRDVPATLVAFEAPGRVRELLNDMCEVFGEGRDAAVCRELTKKFEEVIRGSLEEVAATVGDKKLKGECVVLVARSEAPEATAGAVEDALRQALETMRVKDAATAVAGAFGMTRREVYQIALEMEKPE